MRGPFRDRQPGSGQQFGDPGRVLGGRQQPVQCAAEDLDRQGAECPECLPSVVLAQRQEESGECGRRRRPDRLLAVPHGFGRRILTSTNWPALPVRPCATSGSIRTGACSHRRASRAGVGIFSDAHLARLKLIGALLERGYTFAHIAELTSAWESGRDIGEVLGLEAVLTSPWSDEIPGYVTAAELVEAFGDQSTVETIEHGVRAGVLEPEGDRYRVPSPRLLNAGIEMVSAGIPLTEVLDLAEALRDDLRPAAAGLVGRVADALLRDEPAGWNPTGEEAAELAAVIARLRPLAQMAVEAFAQAMESAVRASLGDRFGGSAAPRDATRKGSAG